MWKVAGGVLGGLKAAVVPFSAPGTSPEEPQEPQTRLGPHMPRLRGRRPPCFKSPNAAAPPPAPRARVCATASARLG